MKLIPKLITVIDLSLNITSNGLGLCSELCKHSSLQPVEEILSHIQD